MKALTLSRRRRVAVLLCLLLTGPAAAQVELASADLSELSLEALLDIPVTTVSRKVETLRSAAAAIYVIQGDELRRLGVHTLPEALRLAPGLHVARISAQDYGITARGFNRGQASNKLEVLVDGRSIYTPLFSGVLWDQQFVPMGEVERIEVIRGPGGTLWGANAVNGVINIVTRPARAEAGGVAQAAAGTATPYFAGARQNLALGERAVVRVHAQSFSLGGTQANGADARDDLRAIQGGFRTDIELTPGQSLALLGDVFDTTHREGAAADTQVTGGHLLGRWSLADAEQSREWELQAYLDQFERDTPGLFGEERQTLDVQGQYREIWGERHDIVAGLNYRRSSDETAPGRVVIFDPAQRVLTRYGVFLQDDITLLPEQWTLTLGAKYEINDFTGGEIQPSVRSAFSLTADSTVWAAVSRAVRIPNRVDHDLAFDTGQADELGESPFGEVPEAPRPSQQCQVLPQNPLCPLIRAVINTAFPPAGGGIVKTGNPDFESEELIAYELGYRAALGARWSLDAAVFYNQYDRLASFENDNRVSNGLEGSAYGVEALLLWQALESTRVRFDLTHLSLHLRRKPGSSDTASVAAAGNDPRFYGGIRVSHAPSASWGAEAALRGVSALSNLGVPGYLSLDLATAWTPRPWLALRLIGRDLLRSQHREYDGNSIARAVEGQLELRWP